MAVAEEMGLMLPIGDWVLQTACTDALRWRTSGMRPIRVAVNLSPSQFRDPSFVEQVEHTLDSVGLDPRALELELSESIIFGQGHSTLAELRRLTRLGIQLAVDDFGAAHSSLRWLLALPVATIKIDKSFIRDVPLDLTGAQVMKALISLAHGLQLRVVAEGVETPEQEEFIEAHGADEMQGFYVSGLLTADEVSALVDRARQARMVGARRRPARRGA